MASADLVAAAVDKFVEEMRLQLFANSAQDLKRLRAAFEQVDFSGTGEVDKENFNDCLNFVGLFPSISQINSLYSHFDPKSKRETIFYSDFLQLLLVPLTKRRAAVVDKAWGSVVGGSSSVSLAALTSMYNADQHPLVRQAKSSAENMRQLFADGFAAEQVTYDAFVEYYTQISAATPRDSFFVELLENCWNIKEVEPNVDEPRMLSLAEVLREKVRQKMRPSESGAITCKRCFMFHDPDDADKLTRGEFQDACKHFGVILNNKDLDDFFYVYGTSGVISINEFSKEVHNGSFEKRVAAAV